MREDLYKPKKKLVYLGNEGTYSHIAAGNWSKGSVLLVSKPRFDTVIKAVSDGEADMGIIPFWNPYREHIREAQEQLLNSDLIATHIYKQEIDLFLVTHKLGIKDIKEVYSNSNVFKQCSAWLDQYLPDIKLKCSSSTATAGIVIKSKKNAAAICSKKAAELYKLDIIADHIQNPRNATLFFIIEKNCKKFNCGRYSLINIKIKELEQRGTILDIFENHGCIFTNQFYYKPEKQDYFSYYIEIDERFYDLNVESLKFDLKQHGFSPGLFGSYSTNITDTQLGQSGEEKD